MSDSDTTKINLQHEVTITNATGVHRFQPGHNVEVPKNMADDLTRMDYDHQNYLNGLNKKHVYEVDSGTISVGSGAE